MGAPQRVQDSSAASALQSFLANNAPSEDSPHPSVLHQLALQVAHNLRYQHLWTDVRLYLKSSAGLPTLPRPLLSGIPPQRLYVHPDEQLELLQKQKDEGKDGMPALKREREWILPSHLREKWSLRRFGEVFDAITPSPAPADGARLFEQVPDDVDDASSSWRQKLPKRLLLATLDDDSTVVYYIVHDGIVKPRQN